MTAAFKKGQKVTLVVDWDRKGTIAVTPAMVYSCGKRIMVLTHALTGEELGRNYRPCEGEGWTGEFVFDGALTEDRLLDLANMLIARQPAFFDQQEAQGRDFSKDRAAMHEARIIRR